MKHSGDRSTWTDAELVEDFLDGNTVSFSILVKRYSAEIFHYTFLKVHNRDTAFDLSQDTFIDAFTLLKSPRYTEQHKFHNWLMVLARNHVSHFLRARNRRRFVTFLIEMEQAEELSTQPDPQLRIKLGKALKQLSRQCRYIVIMHFIKQKTFEELAEKFGLDTNTVSKYSSNSIKKMRKVMGKRMDD